MNAGEPAGAGVPGAGLNEIVPGWMWSDNAYALVRRMYKFESGNAASRRSPDDDAASTWKTGFFAGRLFGLGLAHKVLKAQQALRAAPPDRPFYLEDTLPGLGKNFLRGKGRTKALAAYEDYLAFFLMRAYADRPGEAWGMELSDLVAAIRKELAHGQPSVPDARSWAAAQRSRLPAFKASMLASLARDDKRGRQVFDDDADFHPAPEEDAAVVRLAGDLKELDRRLELFVKG